METFLLLGVERDGLALLELAIRRQRELAWGGDLDFALEWDERCGARGALARASPREAPHWSRLRASERAWRSVACEIAPERRLELRYEHLIGEFTAQLARVGDFLGIDFAGAGAREIDPPTAPSRLFAGAFGARVARLLRE